MSISTLWLCNCFVNFVRSLHSNNELFPDVWFYDPEIGDDLQSFTTKIKTLPFILKLTSIWYLQLHLIGTIGLWAKLCFVVLDSLMFLKLINHSMLVFACSSFSFFSVMMSTSMSNLSKWWTLFVISILSTEVSLMQIFLREKWILHQLQSAFASENDQNDLSALLFILAQKWCM